MTSAGRKWDLTPEAFDRLLAHLAPDRDAAAQEYERVRRMLLNFFGWRGCQSPGEEADETFDRVARKLEEGEPVEHIHRYIFGVARRVSSESSKRRDRERAMLTDLVPSPAGSGTSLNEDRSACLDTCLPRLAPDDRTLLAEYYAGRGRANQANRRRQADRLCISYGAMRVRAHRARTQLEGCLTACLKTKGWDLQ